MNTNRPTALNVNDVFTHNGVTLRVAEISQGGTYTLFSTTSCGVWFATPAQMVAAGITS